MNRQPKPNTPEPHEITRRSSPATSASQIKRECSPARLHSPAARDETSRFRLLLREMNHRCSNDLQLVASLLSLQSRRAASDETRQTLAEVADRVAILARARAALMLREPTLESALRDVCVALQSQAEPRSIVILLEAAVETDGLSDNQITTLALAVNELVTNAVKHAFEDDCGGRISVGIAADEDRHLVVTVDDDGSAFPITDDAAQGLGMDLVRRSVEAIGGELTTPANGSKRFQIRVRPDSR